MIRSGITRAGLVAFLAGLYQEDDRYRMALYEAGADIGPETETYQSEGEVSGEGYEESGRIVTGWKVDHSDDGGLIRFDDVVWPNSTITARGALIYNDSRPGVPSVAVWNFGKDVQSTNGPFRVSSPSEGVITLVPRISHGNRR